VFLSFGLPGKTDLDFNGPFYLFRTCNKGFACPMRPTDNRIPFAVPPELKEYEQRCNMVAAVFGSAVGVQSGNLKEFLRQG
jgi:hypothetical protein